MGRNGPVPNDRARFVPVELDAREAAELAPFTLVALHDNWSTRRLNAANFRTYIADAELRLGEPRLAVLPLPVHDERWRPEGLRRGISAPLLRGDSRPRPLVVSHPLPPRPRGSS